MKTSFIVALLGRAAVQPDTERLTLNVHEWSLDADAQLILLSDAMDGGGGKEVRSGGGTIREGILN